MNPGQSASAQPHPEPDLCESCQRRPATHQRTFPGDPVPFAVCAWCHPDGPPTVRADHSIPGQLDLLEAR